MRKVLLGLAGAAALAASSVASAQLTVVDTGAYDTTVTYTPVTGSAGAFSFGITDTALANSFQEFVYFEVGSGDLHIGLTNSPTNVDFTKILLEGSFDSGASWTYSNALLSATGATANALEFGPFAVASGFYRLTLEGARNGSTGSLGGSVSISNVPEPATWAMLLVGFGAIGSQIRRRRQRMQVQFA